MTKSASEWLEAADALYEKAAATIRGGSLGSASLVQSQQAQGIVTVAAYALERFKIEQAAEDERDARER